jgi:hypothetical protein
MSVFFATLLIVGSAAQDRPLPDLQMFAAHVREHLQTDEERQRDYTYVERRRQQKLDASGTIKDESVKVFEVYPGLPGEDRYRRLVEENGQPVLPAKLAKEDRERQKEAEEYARKLASDAERQKADRELQKERAKRAAAINDIFYIYDIRMLRREPIEGHDTILFSLTPRAGVTPRTDDGKVMRHFKARAWISESDYELVRIEIEAIDDLSIGLGLLARVHKGTTATFQRRKVNDEAWLPEAVTYRASGRLMLLKRVRIGGISEFSNYRKFTVDTSTTYTPPKPPER